MPSERLELQVELGAHIERLLLGENEGELLLGSVDMSAQAVARWPFARAIRARILFKERAIVVGTEHHANFFVHGVQTERARVPWGDRFWLGPPGDSRSISITFKAVADPWSPHGGDFREALHNYAPLFHGQLAWLGELTERQDFFVVCFTGSRAEGSNRPPETPSDTFNLSMVDALLNRNLASIKRTNAQLKKMSETLEALNVATTLRSLLDSSLESVRALNGAMGRMTSQLEEVARRYGHVLYTGSSEA